MTAVRQTFSWNTVDGRPITSIEQWITSLTEPEQQEYIAARKKQDIYRQEAIDAGLMIRDKNGDYIWRDSAAAKQGKGTDVVWHSYFQRWQQECGVTLKIQFIEE